MENWRMFGQYYTPGSITSVVAKLAEEWKSQRILDPSCGAGDLLASVSSVRQDAGNITLTGPRVNAAAPAWCAVGSVTESANWGAGRRPRRE